MPAQYYDLTANELDAMLAGVEARDIRQWRHTRAINALLYNINVDKKDRKTDQEFMPLPGDNEAQKEPEYLPPNVFLRMLSSVFDLPLKEN